MDREEITPKFEKTYWLGYISDGEHHGMFCSGSPHAAYWGLDNERHVFVGLTGDRVAVYATRDNHCYLSFFGGGDDEPCTSAPDVSFSQFMPSGRCENLARSLIEIAKEEHEKEVKRINDFNSRRVVSVGS